MKILYLITKSEAGGAQTHVYQLCESFRAKHTITVSAYPGGWLEEKCKELGIRFIPNVYFSNSMNPLNIMRSFFRIKAVVKEVQPDIVHCHSSTAGFLGRMAVRKKIPTLYTAHGWGFNIGVGFFQKWMSIVAEKLASRYTTKIICVSEFVKNLGMKYRIAKPELFEVIYNGVELQNKQTAKQADIFNIVFVGRLAKPKRPLLLLEALNLLPQDVQKKVHVSIIGDGPQKGELDSYVSTHAMNANVTLHGALPRKDVFDILHTTDMFVLLSDWEGLPITILEAMSVGLPIITSDVGGIREAVDTSNGILLHSKNPQEVADAIERLCVDTALRQRIGEVSHTKAQTHFSLEHMCQKTDAVYKACVQTSNYCVKR